MTHTESNVELYDSPLTQVDGASVQRGHMFYETICERIASDWDPKATSIGEFKSKQLADLCEELSLSKEQQKWHVCINYYCLYVFD